MGLPQLPHLSTSCCCCSLKTGTVIIGSLQLAGSVILMLAGLSILLNPQFLEYKFSQAVPDRQDQPQSPFSNPPPPGYEETTRLPPSIESPAPFLVVQIAASVLLVIGILGTVIASCLVHGARTANKRLMMPWIILTAMGLILDIGNIFKAFVDVNSGIAFSSILGWVVGAYLLLVVWSYKEEVETGTNIGVVHKQRAEKV